MILKENYSPFGQISWYHQFEENCTDYIISSNSDKSIKISPKYPKGKLKVFLILKPLGIITENNDKLKDIFLPNFVKYSGNKIVKDPSLLKYNYIVVKLVANSRSFGNISENIS